MTFCRNDAELYIPDGAAAAEAYRRSSILAVGAHPDDLEIMAIPGILQAQEDKARSFFGVVCTNGCGSLREGEYAGLTYLEMREVRIREQKQAADIGRYSAVALLGYESAEMKDACDERPNLDLKGLIGEIRPDTVFLHNPFDRHDTHVAVCLRTIAALRAVASETGWLPQKIYGCEVWRGLDWLVHCDRTVLPVHDPDHVSDSLIRVYKSQLAGVKLFDLAARGRRIANATYQEAHSLGSEHEMAFAVDLLPLVEDPSIPVSDYVRHTIERFQADALSRLDRFSPHSPCRNATSSRFFG